MGFFTNLRNAFKIARHQSFPPSFTENPEPWLINAIHGGGVSGEAVTRETAVRVSAFLACLTIRSETLASFPLEIYKYDENGNEVLFPQHPLWNLVHNEPNQNQTSYIYRQTKQIHFDTDGNAYSWIKYNNSGQVISLDIIEPSLVQPKLLDGRIWYKIKGIEKLVNSAEILHWMNFSFNGFQGINQITALNPNLTTGLAAQDYANNYFANRSHMGGVIESDAKPPPDKRNKATRNLLKNFNLRYSGVGNAGTTGVLWQGMKFKKLGDNIKESMLLEVKNMTVPEIARAYRIPLPMLMQIQSAGQIKQEQITIALSHSLLGQVTQIEQEYNKKLLRPNEIGKVFFKLNMNSLLKADTEAMAAMLTALFNMQALSPDEARRQFGIAPRTDGEGGEYGLPFASNIKTDETTESTEKDSEKTESKSNGLITKLINNGN